MTVGFTKIIGDFFYCQPVISWLLRCVTLLYALFFMQHSADSLTFMIKLFCAGYKKLFIYPVCILQPSPNKSLPIPGTAAPCR